MKLACGLFAVLHKEGCIMAIVAACELPHA